MIMIFSEEELPSVRALAVLSFANPFGVARTELEACVLKRERVREAPWSRSLEWPDIDPVIEALRARAEALLSEALKCLAKNESYSEEEAELYQDLMLYVLYYRYEERFYAQITDSAENESYAFYDSFCEDVRKFTQHIPLPSWVPNEAFLFSLFFQMRRAFLFTFHRILGRSAAAAKLRESVWQSVFTHDPDRYLKHLLGRMHENSTLILGASGTGKELVASAIASASFIPFNPKTRSFRHNFRVAFHPLHLAAMTKTLIESELFGHKKGSFTGALSDRAGHLEEKTAFDAVFLDEIGELDLDVQVKLLRVLQSRSFHRLGDAKEKSFGGKIIAATNRDLEEEMAQGRFRNDLYYRLCADIIHTPSLADQLQGSVDELAHLVAVIVHRVTGDQDSQLSASLTERIVDCVGVDYRWPGNIRELEQCVRNLLIRGSYAPRQIATQRSAIDALCSAMREQALELDDVVSRYVSWVYEQTGSFTGAAEVLGVDRRTVSKHVEREKC